MTNSRLVQYLINREVLRSPQIIEAFTDVDRAFFVPTRFLSEAYMDYPLPIGEGQTISQPSTVAIMLELLEAHEGDIVLEIGGGSGWVTALLSRVVGPEGFVYSYEINKNIANFGRKNLSRFTFHNYTYEIGDVKKYWNDKAPYNRIISGAAMENDEIDELTELLTSNGVLVIPTKDRDIIKIVKDSNGNISSRRYSGFVFVPLT